MTAPKFVIGGPQDAGQRTDSLVRIAETLRMAHMGSTSFEAYGVDLADGHRAEITLNPKMTYRPVNDPYGRLPMGGARCSCGAMSGPATEPSPVEYIGGRTPVPRTEHRAYPEVAAFLTRHLADLGELDWARIFAVITLAASCARKYPDGRPPSEIPVPTTLPGPVARAHHGIQLILDRAMDADLVTPDAMLRLGLTGGPPGLDFDGDQRQAVYELLAIGYRHAPALQPVRTVGGAARWLTTVLQIARIHGPETALHAGLTLTAVELTAATTDPATVQPGALRILYSLGEPRDYDDLD